MENDHDEDHPIDGSKIKNRTTGDRIQIVDFIERKRRKRATCQL